MPTDPDILKEKYSPGCGGTPLLYAPPGPIIGVISALFVLASLSHLWLADAAHPDWYFANTIYLVGLFALCWPGRVGNPAGWLLSALGLAIPLLFHRDQLTQSMILVIFALTAGGALLYDGARKNRAGGASRGARHSDQACRRGFRPGEWVLLRTFQGVTVATYFLAVLHKINREFFRPAYSCATYGVEGLLSYWHLSAEMLPAGWQSWAPWWVLAGEAGIVGLYLLGQRRLAWPFAVAFHIPLTLVMAPAFAFVMLVGHAAFSRPADITHLRGVLRRRGIFIATAAALLTAASLWMHRALPEWTMIPREWLLWALLVLLALALFTRREPRPPDGQKTALEAQNTVPGTPQRAVSWGIIALFLLNGLTPYLGLQYQHAGAMVSGLRVDKGCWNSLIFPESMRITDDYIRIDTIYFGAPGRISDYEAIVREQLWTPPRLRQMRRNWCRPDVRPIHLAGTFRERAFQIDDLCADTPLPFADDGIFGVDLFPGYLRFQKNLARACPQTCIH